MTGQDTAQILRQNIETRLGTTITDLRFFAAGQSADLYVVDVDQDRRIMAKTIRQTKDAVPAPSMEVEGWMLDYLARKTGLPVPRVHWYDSETILMDYVQDSGMLDDDAQADAAEAMAALHAIRAEFFGLERDSVVASFTQPNHFEMSWVTFFRDYRLLYMAGEALKEKAIDAALMGRIEKLAAKIGSYITSRASPSLIHGDMWEGNVLFGPGRISAFLDPAIYYADPEMELAAISVFGTFGEEFFNCYHDIRPITPEFHETSRDIYALYPLLVQSRLGHQGAAKRVADIVERFAG